MKTLIQKIKKSFTKQPAKDSFGDFFLRTSASERTEVLRSVAKKANEEQRDLLRQYDKAVSSKPNQ